MRLAVALAAFLAGCTGELRELDTDGGAMNTVGGDLGGARPDASGGGGDSKMMPPPATFASTIQKDMDAIGCTANTCHGGGQIAMHVLANATAQNDLLANYGEVQPRASSGAMSLILEKNLMGSSVSHGGGKPFASTGDATYQRWLAWIDAGAPSGL